MNVDGFTNRNERDKSVPKDSRCFSSKSRRRSATRAHKGRYVRPVRSRITQELSRRYLEGPDLGVTSHAEKTRVTPRREKINWYTFLSGGFASLASLFLSLSFSLLSSLPRSLLIYRGSARGRYRPRRSNLDYQRRQQQRQRQQRTAGAHAAKLDTMGVTNGGALSPLS